MAKVKLRCIMGCPGLKSSYREKRLLPFLPFNKIDNLLSSYRHLTFHSKFCAINISRKVPIAFLFEKKK